MSIVNNYYYINALLVSNNCLRVCVLYSITLGSCWHVKCTISPQCFLFGELGLIMYKTAIRFSLTYMYKV